LTDQALRKERVSFLVGFFAIVGIGVVFELVAMATPPDLLEGVQSLGAVLSLVARAVFVYLVFRLSRFLRQPVWLTVVYCVLAPFSLLYLVPFVGLLVALRNARPALLPSVPSGGAGPGAQDGSLQ
jgi:hypothetical protein